MKLPTFFLTLLLVASCVGEELVIQNGLRDYAGASDATLVGRDEKSQVSNFGGSETLEVAGVAHGGLRKPALIQFRDLNGPGGIPASHNRTIKKALLRLYKVDQPKDVGQYNQVPERNRVIRAMPMLTAWEAGGQNGEPEEGAVCFSFRAYRGEIPEFWGDASQIEEGPVKEIDYTRTAGSPSPFVSGNDVWMEWDITPFVKQWLENPESNHGFYLTALSFYVGATFASCDSSDATLRPKLIIEF